jgi:hypothetical protein
VIDLLDSLKAHDPDAFARGKVGTNTGIKDGFAVISGEPMDIVEDAELRWTEAGLDQPRS